MLQKRGMGLFYVIRMVSRVIEYVKREIYLFELCLGGTKHEEVVYVYQYHLVTFLEMF